MRIGALMSSVYREFAKSRLTQNLQHQIWRRMYCIQVNVTSREMIKPCYPTPNDKRFVQFSLIDQIAPPLYNSIVVFYKNNNPNNSMMMSAKQTSKLLKESLSKVLVDFYPLAGRIKQNELIECNDQGVEFCETHPSESFIEFIEKPNLGHIQALLPFRDSWSSQKDVVASVQVNHFSCGGMAIGLCLSHKIADGSATADFLKAWAAKAQANHNDNDNDSTVTLPTALFNGATIFPPLKEYNEMMIDLSVLASASKEKIAMRRFIFDKKAIDALKAEAGDAITRPTSVEVVTTFMWKHLPKYTSIMHLVNLRKRVSPPVPEGSFGNFAWTSRTPPTVIDAEHPDLTTMINVVRRAIKKIDDNYIQKLFFGDSFMVQLKKETDELFGMPESCLAFTSMIGFGVYEIDFGLGTPVWACPAAKPFKNASLFMTTPCGHGIEAWICLHEDDIAHLDNSLSQSPFPIPKPMDIN